MKRILIIGAGAMGAAFSVPLIDNNQKVTITEPYNLNLLKKINNKKRFHPALKINLSNKLSIKKFNTELLNQKWDLIVIAVSSLGIDMIRNYLKNQVEKIRLSSYPLGTVAHSSVLDSSSIISSLGCYCDKSVA